MEASRQNSSENNLILMPGSLSREWIEKNALDSMEPAGATMKLDFSKTTTIDSAGISLIHLLHRKWKKKGKTLILANISDELLQILGKWSSQPPEEGRQKKKETLFVALGSILEALYNEFSKALSIFVETIYWGTIGLLYKRDYRRGVLGEQMYQLGFNAIGIVALLSFLIGVILSIQSALQLKQFGADIYVVSMITMSMVMEIGPLMTAIILAGRSGSATTAEIATMSVQEEIDAIKTMGLNHIQFIVVPKFWAISITMPILVLLSIASGIFGGFVVSMLYLDFAPSLFWRKMCDNIILKDLIICVFKSIAFSWLIIWIGAYYGLKVRGGAEEVGKETTASVVTAIFVIIIADALFSFIYNIKF